MIKAKNIDVKVCTSCNKYFHRNKWAQFNEEILKKLIKESAREKLRVVQIKLPKHKINPGIDVNGESKVEFENEIYLIPFKIRYTLCNKCSKIGSSYFEAILQLRNPNQDVVKFIENNVAKNKEKGVFITKREDVRNGLDFYLTSQRYAQSLGKKLKKTFKGELKVSRKLFTTNRQTGKLVYRVNVLFRIL